jgi:hypothetical protein
MKHLSTALLALALCAGAAGETPSYTISTFAGRGPVAFSQNGAQALTAQFLAPSRAAADTSGNLYVSDAYYHQVFRIAANGIVTVVAGTGTAGYFGDGGLATSARLNCPSGLAVDSSGELYIADSCNRRVRHVDRRGFITTFAGSGTAGDSGDNGPAVSATFNSVDDVAFDALAVLSQQSGEIPALKASIMCG